MVVLCLLMARTASAGAWTPPVSPMPKMSTNSLVFIRSNAGDFVLAAKGNSILLRKPNSSDPEELWSVINLGGWKYQFINRANQKLLWYPGGKRPLTLEFRNTPVNSTNTGTWSVAGDGAKGIAIRPSLTTDMNVNVFGNGPYHEGDTVGTWDWGGGAPNETWIIQPVR